VRDKLIIWASLSLLAGALTSDRLLVLTVPLIGRLPLLDIVVALLAIIGAIRFKKTSPKTIPLFIWLGMLFVAISGIALLGSARWLDLEQIMRSGLFWLRWIAYFGLVFWAAGLMPKAQQLLTKVLGGIWVIVALLGWVQLWWMPNLGWLEKWGWDPHQARIVSTFLDPNLLGGFLILGIAFSAGQLSQPTLSRPVRQGWSILAILLLLTTIFTYSRSALAALLVLAVLIGWRYWKAALLGIAILGLIYSLSPRLQSRVAGAIDLDATAEYRLESWNEAITIIRQQPFLGVGYNTLQFTKSQYLYKPQSHASTGFDSSLLTIAATTGGLGIAVYLCLLIAILAEAKRRLHSPATSGLAWAVIWGTNGLFMHALFVNSWLYSPIMAVWWIMIGLMWSNFSETNV